MSSFFLFFSHLSAICYVTTIQSLVILLSVYPSGYLPPLNLYSVIKVLPHQQGICVMYRIIPLEHTFVNRFLVFYTFFIFTGFNTYTGRKVRRYFYPNNYSGRYIVWLPATISRCVLRGFRGLPDGHCFYSGGVKAVCSLRRRRNFFCYHFSSVFLAEGRKMRNDCSFLFSVRCNSHRRSIERISLMR